MSADFDVAIIGSGFAGSLLAMILRRQGRSVIMIERGRHPRFVIGESSTPLANLLLDELARRYDLPQLLPLTKWGSWRRELPQINVGLKRGFTFYHHRFGEVFGHRADRSDQLLVAASPCDEVSDTHWYRPEFDHHLMREAQALGAEYLDETKLDGAVFDAGGASLTGQQAGRKVELRSKFVVDATGPRGCLHQLLGLPEIAPDFLPRTQALFTHFHGVRRWDEIHAVGDTASPYPVDDAAVHHVFDGGWIWMLRFSNGITSAGVAMTERLAEELRIMEGAPAWARLLERLPSVGELFANAAPCQNFTHMPRVAFRGANAVGANWAMLPSAAGFIDPLLSSGFPLTLLGIGRMAEILEQNWLKPTLTPALKVYEQTTRKELDAAEKLVAALYGSMRDFRVFVPLTMLYFAAASYSETARRLGRSEMARGFLLNCDLRFFEGFNACCELAATALDSPEPLKLLRQKVAETIAPFDVAGLNKPGLANWHPVNFEDLFAAGDKLNATVEEIKAMLARAGLG